MNFVASSLLWVYQKLKSPETDDSTPTDEEQDGITGHIRHLDDQISVVKETCDKKDNVKYILLTIYGTVEGGVLAGVLSGDKMKNLMGCASAWSTIILSTLVSLSIIGSLVLGFFQQFNLLKRGQELQQQRDSAIDASFPNESAQRKYYLFNTYKNDKFQMRSAHYWPPRAAFLAVLLAISACLLVSCFRLIC